MAMLTLTQMWINLASTGQSIYAPTMGNESITGLEGSVRTYAGGRQRAVGREGIGGQLERTLRIRTSVIADLLESWEGQTVMVRDARGQWWWGVFWKVTRHAIKGSALYDLTITVNLVTQAEGV